MKHLLDIPSYDERAFLPVCGRMRLFGKSDPPPPPDYVGQAKEQSAGNLEAARAQTTANRIDQITPYGSIKYTNGRTFDQSGYDAALSKYEADLANSKAQRQTYLDQQSNGRVSPGASLQYGDEGYNLNGTDYLSSGGLMGSSGGGGRSVSSQELDSFMALPTAVNRDDFYQGDQDKWSSEIMLSDTGRQLLDASNKTQLGLADLQGAAMDRVRQSQATPFDTSGLIDVNSQTGMDAWTKASQLIKDRNAGSLNAQQAALDTKLANQGLTAGSEGWGIQQGQFGKQRNDADMAAEMAGLQAQNQFFGQALAGNASTLQQRNFLRQLPLNELNALRTGAQVANPTFSTPGQQGQTSGPDLLGATGSQYSAQVGANNAQNAQAAQQTQAAAGLAAAGIGAWGSAAASGAVAFF